MSKFNLITFTAVGLLMMSSASQAEMRWSTKAASMAHGTQGAMKMPQAGGHNNMRRDKTLFLQDSTDAKLWMITPTIEERSLKLEDNSGKLKVPSTGMGSYHALVASRQEDTLHESALRYEYLRGKPTGRSPAELMANNKLPLEIVPDPMAREHWRFYSQNEHEFIVRFNGQPVQGAWVGLKTSNRSELESTTDANGRVSFILPDDLKMFAPGVEIIVLPNIRFAPVMLLRKMVARCFIAPTSPLHIRSILLIGNLTQWGCLCCSLDLLLG